MFDYKAMGLLPLGHYFLAIFLLLKRLLMIWFGKKKKATDKELATLKKLHLGPD